MMCFIIFSEFRILQNVVGFAGSNFYVTVRLFKQ